MAEALEPSARRQPTAPEPSPAARPERIAAQAQPQSLPVEEHALPPARSDRQELANEAAEGTHPPPAAGDSMPARGSRPDTGDSDRRTPLVEASPDYAANRPPAYPRSARLRGWEGVVLLRVTVGIDGSPDGVVMESSSGYPVLDEAALGAVRRWRFIPARRGDRPVVDEVLVPLHFEFRR